jgi:hypothetical protein
MKMQMDTSSLHYAIVTHFLEHQHAPLIDELAVQFRQPREAVVAGLRALQDYHGVVLHPTSSEVWVVHPFSTAPTSFWVQSPRGSWWANCAWCSAGVATLVGDVTITTTLGAEARQVRVQVENGKLRDEGLLVHFPVPMRHVWDNVIYTCSTMVLFESEARIDDWCNRHRIPKGSVQPLSRVFELAKVWYGRHADPAWKKWSGEEARAIFEKFGLTGPTWDIPTNAARF